MKKCRKNKKQDIINCALKLFSEQGYHSTSIRNIAKTLNISTSLMYNYFSSKEELLDVIISNIFDLNNQMLEFIKNIKEPYIVLKTIIETSFDMIIENPDYWKLYISLLFQNEILIKYDNELNNIMNKYIKILTKVFKKLKIKFPELEARNFVAELDGSLLHAIIYTKNYPLQKIKKYLIKKYTKKLDKN